MTDPKAPQMPDLLPCPFCGSKAWRDEAAGGQYKNVCCSNDKCGLENAFMDDRQWNTRAPTEMVRVLKWYADPTADCSYPARSVLERMGIEP